MTKSIEKRKNSYRLTVCHSYDLQEKTARHTKTIHGTKAQTSIKLAKFVSEIQHSIIIEGKIMTFAEFKNMQKILRLKKICTWYLQKISNHIRNQILPYLCHFRLDNLKTTT